MDDEWDPTDEVFAAYARREVELAAGNISLLRSRSGGRAFSDQTLHSREVFFLGMQRHLASKAAS